MPVDFTQLELSCKKFVSVYITIVGPRSKFGWDQIDSDLHLFAFRFFHFIIVPKLEVCISSANIILPQIRESSFRKKRLLQMMVENTLQIISFLGL